MKTLLAIAMLHLSLCLGAPPAWAEPDSKSNRPPTESLKKAATKIGHAFRDVTREIGHASRDAWNESAQARKDAGNEAEATGKTRWQSFKDEVRDAWRKLTDSADPKAN